MYSDFIISHLTAFYRDIPISELCKKLILLFAERTDWFSKFPVCWNFNWQCSCSFGYWPVKTRSQVPDDFLYYAFSNCRYVNTGRVQLEIHVFWKDE